MKKILFLVILGFTAINIYGQGYVEAGYTPSRNFMKDEDGEKLGTGDMWQLRGRHTFQFSAKLNEREQPIVWSGTLSGMYAHMNNDGMACRSQSE